MDSNKYTSDILASALEQREKEVAEYQVNINNFSLAIEEIGADEDLQQFKKQLQDLLKANSLEQKKSKIMLSVIKNQLGV